MIGLRHSLKLNGEWTHKHMGNVYSVCMDGVGGAEVCINNEYQFTATNIAEIDDFLIECGVF